ncbi:endonuclease/exonuclease/phosphatase family protein [Flavobacteriales bacterium ALC-1]|nr:endonuclease/exonuclease/phosphatase family protein [Flavobacteriales bacterium ALC-1]
MDFRFKQLCFALLLLSSATALSQSAAITIDGLFDDWNSSLTTYTDTPESLSGIDILELQVTNDEDFLFIKIKTDIEFDLTDNLVNQQIRLYIDTDNNPNTGFNIQNGYGSELGIIFKDLFAHYNVDPYSQVSFGDLRLRVAPTVTSNEFEIAIGRDQIPDGTNPLFTSSTIKILLKNNANSDELPNIGNTFSYTFDDTPTPSLIPTDISKSNPSDIRLMTYNTLFNGFNDVDRVDNFENIIRSIAPDIIGLNECWNTSETYVKSLLDTWLPTGTQNGWYVEKIGGQITLSRWEIIQEWQNLSRQFPVLIDLPSSYPTDLLFTNAHLNCCGADQQRQDQADEYAAFILDAKSPGGNITLPENTPFIYSGDLNLVGYAQQLTTLKTGDIQDTATYGVGAPLDWDDTALKEENSIQTDLRMGYTWRSDGEGFPPGKLDFIIFSDHTLTAEKSFVLQTEVMPTDRLNLYNLNLLDTSSASDHFPVVADFSINETLSTGQDHLAESSLFPNPTNGLVTIDFKASGNYKLQVFNSLGKPVLTKTLTAKTTVLDVRALASGFYILSIQNAQGHSETHKLIKN